MGTKVCRPQYEGTKIPTGVEPRRWQQQILKREQNLVGLRMTPLCYTCEQQLEGISVTGDIRTEADPCRPQDVLATLPIWSLNVKALSVKINKIEIVSHSSP